MKTENKKFDVYQMITDKVLNAIQTNNSLVWVKSWSDVQGAYPCNGRTGKRYRGVNMFLLSLTEFTSNYWYTYNQIQELGGTLKKGSTSNQVVFWKMLKTTEVNQATGKKEEKIIPMLKYYNVFNYEQTEGIKLKEVVLPNESAEPIELCENVVSDYTKRCKLKQLVIGASDRAYYSPSKDLVNMPMLEQFKSTEEYYSVMFHELAHSTGHESRLKRKEVVQGGLFGSTDYGLEELVAELTASFVSAEVGISNESTERNSQAYLKGWYEAISADRKMFITASARASKSADLILNRLEVVTQED